MVKLYAYWGSSCSWRARLALGIKGIEYESVPVDLLAAEQHVAGFEATSPLRQVPVLELEHEGKLRRFSQSVAIIEFLEELKPTPALYPSSAADRAVVRQLVEMVNAGIQPLQNLFVLLEIDRLGGDRLSWAQLFVQRGLEALEAAARPHAGKFCFGDAVTAADVFLAPQLFNARRFSMDLQAYPTLLRAEASLQAHPAWASAHPDAARGESEAP
ncbi:MAG: maleylacetoacetate isomerase [Polyangiaceae bacterium]